MAHGAVDVLDRPAAAAYQVMVIVPHPGLVAGRARPDVDLSQQARLREGAQGFIDGLQRHVPNPFADGARHLVGVKVPSLAHDFQDRQPGRRHAHPRGPQPVGAIHGYLYLPHGYGRLALGRAALSFRPAHLATQRRTIQRNESDALSTRG